MPKTFAEIKRIVELRKNLKTAERIEERPDIPADTRIYFRKKADEVKGKIEAISRELTPIERMRVYSREVTPYLLDEMNNDPFILLFLPFYIVGLASTVPGNVAEGAVAIINKVTGKEREVLKEE